MNEVPDAASSDRASDITPRKAFRRIALWLMAGGVVLRLLFFVGHSDTPMFGVPVLDEAYYDSAARELAADSAPTPSDDRGFRPLLYPTLVAAVYSLAGDTWGIAATLAAHHVLGLLTALMVAALAWRLFDRPAAGAWAGALYLLAAPPLYFEGQLLIVTFFTCLGSLLLLWLATCDLQAPWWRWAIAGVVVGVMAQARANALILVLAFPLAAWRLPVGTSATSERSGDPTIAAARIVGLTRRAAAVIASGSGVVLVLVLVGFWQREALGSFQLLPSAGGVNLYLGNKQGADGMIPRQDVHTSYGDNYRDSVQVFADQTYLETTGATKLENDAVSRFWLNQTRDEIIAAPLEWLKLMARKSLLLVWNEEIPNNKSFAFALRESPILGLLPVRFWLLLGLAGIGLMATTQRSTTPAQRSLRLWLLLYLSLLASAIVLFFVNARFRLPLWPALAVLAGGGVLELIRLRHHPKRLARGLSIFVLLAALSLVNWLGVAEFNLHRDYFHRSLAHWTKGDLPAARADAERSVELEPNDAVARFHLATVALAQDDLETAEQQSRTAGRLAPSEARIHNMLGLVLEEKGREAEAYRAYIRAAELGLDFSPPHINAALIELRMGALDLARRHITQAEQNGDRSVALQCARGFLETLSGRADFGQALIDGAAERDPELTKNLLRKQGRRLDSGRVLLQPQDAEETTP